MIPHVAVLAERVFPMSIGRLPLLAPQDRVLAQAYFVSKFQPQPGTRQYHLAIHRDAVAQGGVGVNGDADLPVGRTNLACHSGLHVHGG